MNISEESQNLLPAKNKTPPMVLHTRVITGSGGGPDKTILNSPRFLQPLGYNSSCLFLHPPGDSGFEAIRRRAAMWDAPIVEVDDRGAFDWKVVSQSLKICRELNVDIWHAHDYKTNLLGWLLRRWHPMRLVTTVHGWGVLTKKTRLYNQVDRFSLPKFDRVLCVSPDLFEKCNKIVKREGRVELIENAIDIQQFRRSRSRDEAKVALGLPTDKLLIGAVGRLSPEKAFDALIRVVHKLLKEKKNLMLAIVGDGPEHRKLQGLVESLGLEKNVQLVGFQEDSISWYEAMDVYALSSLREGLPNVILEAMALETPIVATRVAGVPRIIEDEKNGLIVPIGDGDAFATALRKLLDNPELRSQLAENGRQTIESRYSFSARMKKITAIYDELTETV